MSRRARRQPSVPARQPRRWGAAALFVALAAATLIAYAPALSGTLLWDDPQHLTRPELRSFGGLWRIWFDLRANQQYYPLLHSAFWLQFFLWGESTIGYHVVNVLLHTTSAWLLVQIARRLGSKGAVLAGLVFALHPVQVESVAWISELKNTLSGVFFFASALAFLRYDEQRGSARYLLALGLFVAALLSKSVTATLPVVLLVIAWWRYGRIRWTEDVLPLVPFLALGAVAGTVTAWYERTGIGASGSDYAFTVVERTLIAGRAVWFYFSSLFWPANLSFVYPRWSISQDTWSLYLFPVALIAVLTAAWLFRSRSTAARAVLAALLVYVVVLGPALGFVNVYPFRFSLVADHFQYHAAAAIFVLATSTIRFAGYVRHAAIVLISLLGAMTFHHSTSYTSAQQLYRDTIARNPNAWLAHVNLAAELLNGTRADLEEAKRHAEIAVALEPEYSGGWYNLAGAHAALGNHVAAVSAYERVLVALEREGTSAEWTARVQWSLGRSLDALGRSGEAITLYERALALRPGFASAHRDLGVALGSLGRHDEALRHFLEAVRLEPTVADNFANAGAALLMLRKPGDAIGYLESALRLDPGHAAARQYLAAARAMLGR
jgi:protein O-mannosyl-transferase